jgi:hypothetical protein
VLVSFSRHKAYRGPLSSQCLPTHGNIFLTLSKDFNPRSDYISNKKFIHNLNTQMLHMLIKKIIPGDHNDKKVMQSSLTGESKSSINSELKKMLKLFSLTFLGTIKYLFLSDIFFNAKSQKCRRRHFLLPVAVYKMG